MKYLVEMENGVSFPPSSNGHQVKMLKSLIVAKLTAAINSRGEESLYLFKFHYGVHFIVGK